MNYEYYHNQTYVMPIYLILFPISTLGLESTKHPYKVDIFTLIISPLFENIDELQWRAVKEGKKNSYA